ncbi:MAG: hypothetical protein IPN47_00775 [Gemmatimonadetes bacterium]|nr:hypothetical protein [Gemmatimonadota bacterium]MBK9406582.1 hypothetical protein [Gemmatimonadota bacterium]
MGLLSTLRTTPKSASIREQLARVERESAAAEAKLTARKDAWRQAVVDGAENDKVSTRSAVKGAEYDLQELQMQRAELEKLLAETEALEAEQAARDQWAADLKQTRELSTRSAKLHADYQKQAAALVETLHALRRVSDEFSEIETRRRTDGRYNELIEETGVPVPPGCSLTNGKLYLNERLRMLPRLDAGQGPYFLVHPADLPR